MQNRFYSDPSSSWQAYYNWLAAQQQAEKDSPAGMASDIGNKVGNIGGKIAAKKGVTAIAKALGGDELSAVGAPLSESGMATTQAGVGPLADMGLASSSPASGAMAQMGGTQSMAQGVQGAQSAASGAEGVAPSALGNAAGALAIALMANRAYEHEGGKQILHGNADQSNWIDSGLASNPVTGWLNPTLSAVGLGSVGKMLAPISTKKQQRMNWQNLADQNITGASDVLDSGADKLYGDNELKSGTLSGKNLVDSSGLYYTFGNDWKGKFNDSQREKIAQYGLDQGLFDSKRGMMNISDPEKLKAFAESVYTPAAPAEPDAGSKLRWRQSDNALMRKYGYA